MSSSNELLMHERGIFYRNYNLLYTLMDTGFVLNNIENILRTMDVLCSLITYYWWKYEL